jgi:hypothetical protein
MNTFSNPVDAELSAEIDTLLAAPCASRPATKKPLSVAQKRKIEAIPEDAMECDGDTVATIYRLLDQAIASLDDTPTNDTAITALNAVRHFHLPSLLDAFEVDTRRAH